MSVLVRRGNGELLIPDEKMAEYLSMGYSVIDSNGKVLVEAEPSTIPQYKALVASLRKQVRDLKAQVAVLEEQNTALKTRNSASKAADGQQPTNSTPEKETAQNAEKPAKNAKQK